MRDHLEVQRAHDILEAVVLGEVIASPPNTEAEAAMHATIDALCWVLGHDHNQTFADNLAKLEGSIAAAGYVLHTITNRRGCSQTYLRWKPR